MKTIKSIFGLLFLLTGLTFLSIPPYYEWQQGKELRALEKALNLLTEESTDDIDLSEIENLSFSEEQLKKVLELEIPSIDLKQKVLAETTEENLKVALTQLKKNQIPGKGNFVIVGHRGYRGDRHFRHLPSVAAGEKVYLHTKKQTYVYEVTDLEVIKPTDVEILNDTENKNEITMITCTVTGLERVAVKGELIKMIAK
ncbi:sortase [Bacillus aquiflavi]|uniref:Sortase n=1 Tax=Bacillus aquiflavi TaxID=2672567 RepID=A0A6B3W529_9BACI|nr:sortase [Bacillus aquiflavi]MBA4538666.1 sortase [Bacillus aquiflavi]NEY83026.1 sortase [Bacillus aquiflavi]UAC48874.1 sortase [Bacillus aquiflavi]